MPYTTRVDTLPPGPTAYTIPTLSSPSRMRGHVYGPLRNGARAVLTQDDWLEAWCVSCNVRLAKSLESRVRIRIGQKLLYEHLAV